MGGHQTEIDNDNSFNLNKIMKITVAYADELEMALFHILLYSVHSGTELIMQENPNFL